MLLIPIIILVYNHTFTGHLKDNSLENLFTGFMYSTAVTRWIEFSLSKAVNYLQFNPIAEIRIIFSALHNLLSCWQMMADVQM